MSLARALTFAVIVAACSPTVSPSPTSSAGFPAVLSVESRGGPTLVVAVNGSEVARVECNDTATLVPGEAGLPPLPWTVSIARELDAVTVFSGQVTALPQWYLQIGDSALGIGSTPPIGPAVTCPPSE